MPEAIRRLLAISRKEFFHILYDFRTLIILFLMPVIQLVMFGYALNLEIQRVDLAVIDFAHSTESLHLVQRFRGSPLFVPFPYGGNPQDVGFLFKSRRAHAALIIPADFDRRLRTEPSVPIQLLIDASNPNKALLINAYCHQVLQTYNQTRAGLSAPFALRPAVLFNPELKSAYFFVPGVIAMILIMISALLTSITIAREKETGTMEQILVSPVRPHEIILGKVLPYVLLAFIDAGVILIIGRLVFGVPFLGSNLLLLSLTALYILTGLSLGLMISTRAQSQQVAMMASLIATLLPTIILSGLIFPIASMPEPLQYLTYFIPARYYLLMVRGIMLKGSVLVQLLKPTLLLSLMASVLLAVSIRKFSANLER